MALDFLFNGSPPANTTAATVSQTNMPDWYQEYTRGLLAKSNAIAAEPYQAYGGQRIADPGADVTQSYDLTRQNIGNYQPAMNLGQQYLTTAGGGFNQTEFDKYLNPYTENVNSRIAQLGQRNLTENLLPGVNQTFTGAGQFGGSRHADFTARAVRDANESILGQQAQTMLNAQNAAMQGYQQGQQITGASGQQLGALGQAVQGAGIKDAAALQAIGQEQQALQQKSLDTAYQDFLTQRDWDLNRAQFLNQQIRGFNPPTSTASTSSQPGDYRSYSPSPLSQLVGTGIAAYGSGMFK